MTTSALRRQVKNIVHNYSEAEIKVREATSNDPWGPSSSLMSEIADLTFNVVAFTEVMGMIWKRLNDHGKNWRHVYKALTLLDYLIKTGSERVAQQCRENVFTVQTLRDFQYVDRDGKDQGVNVREKAKQLVCLMRDEERLKQERAQALKTKERMAGLATGMGSGSGALPPPYPGRRTSQPSMAALYGEEFSRSRGSPSSFNSSDLEQARPQTSGEEELQLQLALAMSREESEKPPPRPEMDEQTQLEVALYLSKEQLQQPAPPPPVALEMDEDMQLQIALSLSKEEHEQEQRSRQGDESLLQKALEESRRESESGTGESAMMDLVDIFGPVSAASPSDDPWDAPPTTLTTSDPWDSVAGARSTTPVIGSPWMAPPGSSSPSQPWGLAHAQSDPWDAPPTAPSPNLASQSWSSPAHPDTGAPGIDPFSLPAENAEQLDGISPRVFTPRSGSPTDADPFGEGGRAGQVNGRREGSPELFDLSRLGETLRVPSPRTCRTPEAFLGPTAASLVNLDALIPPNPPTKNKNPFLSGLSAPSPTNPFHSEQPRLTLNQMRPSSTSPLPPAALPYSASLPLPLSHQPPALPSSFTQPARGLQELQPAAPPGLLEMPTNLPQPLLPLSPAPPGAESHAHNPFL
ncbi:epsin-3 isoform X1 [Conger conger]|uniref:epsin-3 isoform X1 n=1 Tax=Conger conger TaxID=82655 RepID=UPI002A5A3D12|nr:epsin-3 isoform X1 [Conger conger]